MILPEQHQERLQALYHLAVELSAQHSLESVLHTALQHCLKLTDSQFGFVGLNTADNQNMDVVATEGFHPAPNFYHHFHLIPLRPNIFSHVVLQNRAVRSDNAQEDPRRVGQPHGHPPVHSFLGVPLRIRDTPIGMIGVANRPVAYEDEHEKLLMTYAAQVAIVIRNARLYEELAAANEDLERKVAGRTQELQATQEVLAVKAEQLQRLLQETVDIEEKERQRIAQGMHDGINQLLYGALLELKSARQRLEKGDSDQAAGSLESVQEVLHEAEAEMTRVIHDLRPPTLDALGLVPALRRHASQFEQFSDLPCVVHELGEAVRLSPQTEINIYRLVQEALQNISVHAQARQATVLLAFTPRMLKITISDDGVGFDLDHIKRIKLGHLGLISMRERAEGLGGGFNIHTRPGHGTQVEVTIPIQSHQPENRAD